MNLSIIIVNYKTPQLTLECIKSIYKETPADGFEIIVVDNNSGDESKQLVTGSYPEIIWIDLTDNMGFGRANNKAIEVAKGDFILLLNSDTIICNKAICKCLDYLRSLNDKTIAGLGCKLLNPDDSIQYSSYHKKNWPNLTSSLLENSLVRKLLLLFHPTLLQKREYMDEQRHKKSHVTHSVSGAFIMFRKNIVNKTGIFDPDFFMYFEEMEWFNRINKNGYKVLYYSDAQIIHYGNKSNASLPSQQINFSQGLFILKLYGKPGYVLYLLINYVNILTNMILFPFFSKENKNLATIYLKTFLPFHWLHWSILFKYKKTWGSAQSPLIFKNKV